MRDFRDAKAMAHTLRETLTAKSVSISHSESLEIVSQMLGAADWNTLSAQIRSGGPAPAALPAPAVYPALPLRDMTPFPAMTFPLFLGRDKTLRALDQAFQQRREVVIAIQKDAKIDLPETEDVYEVGLLARIIELLKLKDGTTKIIVTAQRRVAIGRFVVEDGAFLAEIADVQEGPMLEAADLVHSTVEQFATYAVVHELKTHHTWPPLESLRDPGRVADVIAPQLPVPIATKQALLATLDSVERLRKVAALIEDGSIAA